MGNIIEELKKLFTQNNIPIFGTTRSSSLENEPTGYRPSDIVPSAQSLLCFGLPVPKGIFKSGDKAEWMYWRAANIYYRNIDAVLIQACSIIEEKDEIAVPVFG